MAWAIALEKLKKEKDALRKAREHAPEQKVKAMLRGVQKAKVCHVKEKGVVPDQFCIGAADLGVLVANLGDVFTVVNESQGMTKWKYQKVVCWNWFHHS